MMPITWAVLGVTIAAVGLAAGLATPALGVMIAAVGVLIWLFEMNRRRH